jgi:TBCC domain-containing protein 1
VLDDNKKRELQSVIQSHFKEWLLSSGNMRQVYDLARMEREPQQH